ncbi:MAG: flippase [Deltaproteobacteria bacterium]
MENLTRRLARNTFFNFIAKMLGFVCAMIVSVITARMLGPARFGSYSLVSTTLTVAGLCANLGLSSVAIKFTSEISGDSRKGDREALFSYLLRFKLLATVVMVAVLLLLSGPFARFYRDNDLRLYVIVSALGLLPSGMAWLFANIISGLQEYRTFARRTMIVAPLTVISSFLALQAGWGIMGLICVTVFVNLVEFLFYYLVLRPRFRFRFDLPLPSGFRGRVMRYNLQVFGIIFLDAIVWQRSEVFFLGKFRSPQEVGFYSLAYSVIEKVLLFLPSILSGVLMPAVSELYGKKDGERIKKLYVNSTRYLLAIAVPLSLGTVFLSPVIVRALFGAAYLPVVPVLNILLISGVFGIVASAGSSVQYATENQDFILKVGSLVAIGNIALDLWLIPRYGAVGAAVANSTAQVCGVLIGTAQVLRFLKVGFPLADLFKILLSALSMGPLISFLTASFPGLTGVCLAVPCAALLYLGCLIGLRFFTDIDLSLIKKFGDVSPRTEGSPNE